jgi:hypothetical protein
MASKLSYHDTSSLLEKHAHGFSPKSLAVLHETVSPDIKGFADISNIEHYLASKDYGIHGMTDAEGNKAWAHGLGRAIFWQAGGVNTQSVGIEQVSNVMLRSPKNAVRRAIWAARNPQLRATAQLLAAWHNADPKNHPLVYSNGLHPGVTSHWDVSQHFSASEGHTDCWPVHKGGYYPILAVIRMARLYAATGVHF